MKKSQKPTLFFVLTILIINLGIISIELVSAEAHFISNDNNMTETKGNLTDTAARSRNYCKESNLKKSSTSNIIVNPIDDNKQFSFNSCNVESIEKLNWANIQFSYRKAITIHASSVFEDLTNFPVLIDLYDTDLKNVAQANGNDIVFTDYLFNKLDHEIELFDQDYNSSYSHLVSWVRVNLSSKEDTRIFLFYGNSTIENQENPIAVWDDDYVGVWHLSENTGIRYDSTVNKFDGSPQNYENDEATVGIIAGADNLDGEDDYIDTFKDASEIGLIGKGPKTVSTWVNAKDFNCGGVFGVGKSGSSFKYFSFGTNKILNSWIGYWGKGKYDNFTYASLNQWVYLTVVFDGNQNVKIFADSQIQFNDKINVDISDDLTLTIGKWCCNSFNGTIDEFRVSTRARSDAWIKTEYNNQFDSISFYSVGNQEGDNSPPIINDFGIEELNDDRLMFYANVTDAFSAVESVKIKINGLEYDLDQNSSDIWVYQCLSVKYGDSFVFRIVNASDILGNYLTEPSIEKEFIYLRDTCSPQVINAYFIPNDEKTPTNLKFFAEIEENGSGIDEIVLYYYFEETSNSQIRGGLGSSRNLGIKVLWLRKMMEFFKESNHKSIYSVDIPFTQNKTNWKVIYRISVSDKYGNMNENAYQVSPQDAERDVIKYTPLEGDDNPIEIDISSLEFLLLIIISIISIIFVSIFISVVYSKIFHKPVRFGIDKNLILGNLDQIKTNNIDFVAALNKHTVGIVVSSFDELMGPSPVNVTPKSLENKSDLLNNIAYRSFSNCEFTNNVFDINQAIFNFSIPKTTSVKVISYSFGLDRPKYRGGQKNITISILVKQSFFPIVNQFIDTYTQRIKKIHKLLNKNSKDKMKIRYELIELREMISKIILLYMEYYGNNGSEFFIH